MAETEKRYDRATLAHARQLADEWKQANGLPYLSPLALNDLVERIERAVLRARNGR
jgi:hypothetical protein